MNRALATRAAVLALAAVVAAWGVSSVREIGRKPSGGYATDGDNTVTRVAAGGPGERAGLRPGDYIRSINGIPVEAAAELAELGRAAVGETRTLVVERDGATQHLQLTYAGLDSRERQRAWGGILVGFSFLGFCTAAFLARDSRAARALALMGLGLGLAFFSGPYFEAAAARSVANTLRNAMVSVGIAATVHFLLLMPRPRPFIARARGVWLLYAPVGMFFLLVAWRALARPEATSGLNQLTNQFGGLLMGGYFLLGVTVLLRGYIRTARRERRETGMGLLFWGVVVGLAPLVLARLAATVSGGPGLPGADLYFLALAAVPASWSAAARRWAGAG